jgi:hypothetical protein
MVFMTQIVVKKSGSCIFMSQIVVEKTFFYISGSAVPGFLDYSIMDTDFFNLVPDS